MSEKEIQIAVLGAEYAGLMAAIRLAGKNKKRPAASYSAGPGNTWLPTGRVLRPRKAIKSGW